jgi:hypothetical protein
LSFFDDEDEAAAGDAESEPTRAYERPRPRSEPRRRRGGSGGDRPPSGSQVQRRRVSAVVAIVMIVIVCALLIHGCQSNRATAGLKDYSASVNQILGQSNQLGASVFSTLQSGASSSDPSALGTKLAADLHTADSQLSQLNSLSVPSQMQKAQGNLQLTLRMRADGINRIASNIAQAYQTQTAQTAVQQISVATSNLYSSDVIYKNYAATEIAQALNEADIQIGGTSGVAINAGQFLPLNLGWLNSTQVALWIGAKVPSTTLNTVTTGTHGHELNYVSVGSSQLSTSVTNTIAASPAPTFTLDFTNSGSNTEYDVVCKVSIPKLGLSATSTIGQTTKNETTTCKVTLLSAPKAGTYTVTAEIEPVPYETDKKNNVLSLPVDFTG